MPINITGSIYPVPVSPESHYCLTGHLEFFTITQDVYEGILYSKIDLDGLFDSWDLYAREHARVYEYQPPWQDGMECTGERFHLIFQNWYENASLMQRGHVGLMGLLESDFQLNEMVATVSGKLIDEYLIQNNINRQSRLLIQYPLNPPQTMVNTQRNLINEDAVLNNADRILDYRVFNRWKKIFREQWERISSTFSSLNFDELVEHERNWIEGRIRFHNLAIREQLGIRGQLHEIDIWPKKQRKKIFVKNDLEAARKSIKKAVKLFTRLFGDQKIKAFLSGHEFIVNGKMYDYRITKSKFHKVIDHHIKCDGGHIPYDLELITKDNIVLASLCIYVENTPVIDQLIALCLYVQNEENEIEYLQQANFSKKTPAYWNDDKLIALKKDKSRRQDGVIDLDDINVGQFRFVEEQPDPVDEMCKRLKQSLIPLVKNIMIDSMGIPRPAMEYMFSPTVKYDELQMPDISRIPRALAEIEFS